MCCRVACVPIPVVGALFPSSVYIVRRPRASDAAPVVSSPVDNLGVTYSPSFRVGPDGRAYRKYIVGTTTMFKSVEVINPERMTIAIGV